VSNLFTVPVQGVNSDERYTPKWVFDGLGLEFAMDPASPGEGGGDCVPARRKLTRDDDGLACSWFGSVWLNPPFSNATPWAQRFIENGQGVFLGPVANSAWCTSLMAAADVVWFVRDFAFTHPTHAGKRSSMPLFMAAMGEDEALALVKLARSGRHDGVLFVPVVDA
tara:strand:+ start:304 stop:804 length:501 start_codon:yes stop_codon:yes gene_type:complete